MWPIPKPRSIFTALTHLSQFEDLPPRGTRETVQFTEVHIAFPGPTCQQWRKNSLSRCGARRAPEVVPQRTAAVQPVAVRALGHSLSCEVTSRDSLNTAFRRRLVEFPQVPPLRHLQALRTKGSPDSALRATRITFAQFSGISLWIAPHSLQSKAHGAAQDCLDLGTEKVYQLWARARTHIAPRKNVPVWVGRPLPEACKCGGHFEC